MDFFDIHHDVHLRQQRQESADARRMARESMSEVEEMRATVDRLHLAATAMWEILNEQFGVSETEFLAKVQEIDLRDGRLDGRIDKRKSPPTACPHCDRPNNGKRTVCLYCAKELPPVHPL